MESMIFKEKGKGDRSRTLVKRGKKLKALFLPAIEAYPDTWPIQGAGFKF